MQSDLECANAQVNLSLPWGHMSEGTISCIGAYIFFWHTHKPRLSLPWKTNCFKDKGYLTLSTLGKIFSRRHIGVFFFSSQKTGFDISCKLSPVETICMKCQVLFSGKNNKNITNLSSAELFVRVVKLKKL